MLSNLFALFAMEKANRVDIEDRRRMLMKRFAGPRAPQKFRLHAPIAPRIDSSLVLQIPQKSIAATTNVRSSARSTMPRSFQRCSMDSTFGIHPTHGPLPIGECHIHTKRAE